MLSSLVGNVVLKIDMPNRLTPSQALSSLVTQRLYNVLERSA